MPAGAKRKRSQKGGTAPKKTRFSREDQDQYYQALDASELPGLGCGTCLLGTPGFTFQSPLDGLMRFEVMSGTEDPGTGSIRLCVPSNGPEDGVDSPVFLVPFKHIKQIIVIDEPSQADSTAPAEQAHRVIIVPTAAVGASPLKRTYPKVISFTLPRQKAGTDFQGKLGEAAGDPDETYCGLVTRAFNDQLAPFLGSVIDASSPAAGKRDGRLTCDAVFKQDSSGPEKLVKGKLFFLHTGILFHSQTTVLYLTCESIPHSFLVFNYEASPGRPGPVNVTFVCSTSGSYYESEKDKSKENNTPERLLISFRDISPDMSSVIAKYAKKKGIVLREVEQDWYSLKQGQPATSWMPRGMRPRP